MEEEIDQEINLYADEQEVEESLTKSDEEPQDVQDNIFKLDSVTPSSSKGQGHSDSALQPLPSFNTNKTTGTCVQKQLYVGGLSWWTKEDDICEVVNQMGVHDLISIKVFENRGNGTSKGFCQLTLNSQTSYQLLLKQLPRRKIDGQTVEVAPATKQALQMFEAQSSASRPCDMKANPHLKMAQTPPNLQAQNYGNMNSECPRNEGPPPPPQMRMMQEGGMPQGPFNLPFNNERCPSSTPQRFGFNGPPPQGPPQYFPSRPPPPPPYFPPPPPHFQQQCRPHQQRWGGGEMGARCGPPPHCKWVRPPPPPGTEPHFNGPPPTQFPSQIINRNGPPFHHQGGAYPAGDGEMCVGGDDISLSKGTKDLSFFGAPAPHLNPSFIEGYCRVVNKRSRSRSPSSPPHILFQMESDGRRRHEEKGIPLSKAVRNDETLDFLSESETLEALSRNMSVSSSAINRAVEDACKGDYGSAIETLVTAMSILKRSKIADDKRCKILVTSLGDALAGIEKRSYDRDRGEDRYHKRIRKEKSEGIRGSKGRDDDPHNKTLHRYEQEETCSRSHSKRERSRSPSTSRQLHLRTRSSSSNETFEKELCWRDRENHYRRHL